MKKPYIAALAFTFLHGASSVNATELTHLSTNIIFNQNPKLSQDFPSISIYFDLNDDGKFNALEDLVLKTKHINEFIAFGQYGIKDYQFSNTDYSYDEMMFFTYKFDMLKSKKSSLLASNLKAHESNNLFNVYHDDNGYYYKINNLEQWKKFLSEIKLFWDIFSSDPYPSKVFHSHYPVDFYFTPTKIFLDNYHGRKPDKPLTHVEMWKTESVVVTLDSFKASENSGLNRSLWQTLVPVPYPDINNLCSKQHSKNCTQFPFKFHYATKSQRRQLQSLIGLPEDRLNYHINQSGDWELGIESNVYTEADSPEQYKTLKRKIESIKHTTNVKIVIGSNQNANDESYQWNQLGSNLSVSYPDNSIIREIRITN